MAERSMPTEIAASYTRAAGFDPDELNRRRVLDIHATGIRSGAPEVLEALLRGDDIDPSRYYFRATVTLESATMPELERHLYVASYVREADRVRYVAYRVT